MTDQQPRESTWSKVNVLAAVGATLAALVGAAVAVAGFLHLGTAAAMSGSTTSQATSGSHGSSAGPPPATQGQRDSAGPGVLPLTSLSLSRGAGNVVRHGDSLTMPCGTNQSDDQYREIAYALPTTSHYQRFHAKVLGGAGEADQLFGVTVFARGQYVRADQTVAIASANLRPGDSGSLGGKLSDGADTLVLRLVCHLPGASITIDGADLDP